jgi:hypothetical protein
MSVLVLMLVSQNTSFRYILFGIFHMGVLHFGTLVRRAASYCAISQIRNLSFIKLCHNK